jgi:hypothetical protein
VSSPGFRIATRSIELRVISASGGASRFLVHGIHPAWSRSGRLAYQNRGPIFTEPPTADIVQSSPSRLRVVPGRGLDACCGLVGPRWSPNDRWIAYIRSGRGPTHELTEQIFRTDPAGRTRRQVTKLLPGGLVEGVYWTRDSKRLFFVWEFTNVD